MAEQNAEDLDRRRRAERFVSRPGDYVVEPPDKNNQACPDGDGQGDTGSEFARNTHEQPETPSPSESRADTEHE